MGTEVDSVAATPRRADALVLLAAEQLPPDVGLVRDHGDHRVAGAEEGQRFERSGKELELLDAPDAGVETPVDDPITIEQHGYAFCHALSRRARRRNP